MVPLTALWLPIILSAVFIFAASTLIHMVLGYHKSDYRPTSDEEALRQALKKQNLPPGQYHVPHVMDFADMKKPEFLKKFEEGPLAIITIRKAGPMTMTPALVQWFIYTVVISVFVAYVTGRVLPAGTVYLQVFRVAGATAFLAYAGAMAVQSIWSGCPWRITIKNSFDGLIYALLTAGTFGWRWPHA